MVMHMSICRVRRGIDKDREDDRDSSVDKPAPPISAPSASTVRKNPSRVVPDQIGECALLCLPAWVSYELLKHLMSHYSSVGVD